VHQRSTEQGPTGTQTGTHCCEDASDAGDDGGEARYSASVQAMAFTKSRPLASSASSVNARHVHTSWRPSGKTHTNRLDELLPRSSAALPQRQSPPSSACHTAKLMFSAHGFTNIAVSSPSFVSAVRTSTKLPMLSTQQPKSSERWTFSGSATSETLPRASRGAKAALMLLVLLVLLLLLTLLVLHGEEGGLPSGLLAAAFRDLAQSKSDFIWPMETLTTEPAEPKATNGLKLLPVMSAGVGGLPCAVRRSAL